MKRLNSYVQAFVNRIICYVHLAQRFPYAIAGHRARVATLEREAEYTRKQRTAALSALDNVSLWDMPGTQANQILRKLLGNWRLTANDADVTGLRRVDG